ncbi:MAG: LysR family transcriptional regulator [Gammaproteobacteria bacterium]|nr:LysR family transcriptional regulator [Gammaproteobacteria bacterium]
MKINHRQLSLRGLRTFCVAARHQNFRRAAEELFVTASAVSYQIKRLEKETGLNLFVRNNRTLSLSSAGRTLFDDVDPLIRQLDDVTASLRSAQHRHTLRISVQPFFASELLVPRLSEFTALHPEIDIHIDTDERYLETAPTTVDVSIRLFSSPPDELESDVLFPLRLVPACAPELRKKLVDGGRIPNKSFPIIVHTGRTDAWRLWSESSGIRLPEPSNIVQLNSMHSIVSAAEQGLGVALVPLPVSKKRFKAGCLTRLYRREVVTQDCYYLVCAKGAHSETPVKALREWVLDGIVSAA